jgi:hypothetical protein
MSRLVSQVSATFDMFKQRMSLADDGGVIVCAFAYWSTTADELFAPGVTLDGLIGMNVSDVWKLNGSIAACVYFLVFASLGHAAVGASTTQEQNSSLVATVVISAGALYQYADAEVASRNRNTSIGGRIDLTDFGAPQRYISPDVDQGQCHAH